MLSKLKRFFRIIGFKNDIHTLILIGRMLVKAKGFQKRFLQCRYSKLSKEYCCEIEDWQNIGENLQLIHPYGITVNPNARIGNDCMIFKGATIGSVRSGRRKGFPILEDKVVVGLNATVVGGITVGSDVMIASNAFVDFDVPSHSLVIGNPGVIRHKDNATIDYIK